MRRPHFNPYLLLALTSLFWAGNMVMSRGLRADLPPVALAFWRWVTAFCCVLPLALPHLKSQWPLLRAAWKKVIFLGVFGVGCYNTFSYVAVQYTTATSATLLNSFIPVVTSVLALAFFGRRLSRPEVIGGMISLVGVVLLISRGSSLPFILVLLGVIPVIALAVVTDALFSLVITLIKGEAGD